MGKVLITGGSGMVGRYLTEKLLSKGYVVHWLSRKLNYNHPNVKIFYWDIETKTIDIRAFENIDFIIHLAGSNVADKRWSEKYKQEIILSRVKSTELLCESIIQNNIPIKKVVGASAVGFYGAKVNEKIYSEDDNCGNDFLAQVCCQWEQSYLPLMKNNVPVSIIRIGLVLSHTGGMYAKLKPLFSLGLGSILGNGKQYMPWIHIDDLCNMIMFLMEKHECEDIYNAVSGEIINNKEFSKKLAHSFDKKILLPNVPAWLLKLTLGERYTMLVTGLKISNDKIKEKGFQFRFEKLEDALNDLKNKTIHEK